MTIFLNVLGVVIVVFLVLVLVLWQMVRIVEAVGDAPGGGAPPSHAEGEMNSEKVETTFTLIEKNAKATAGRDVDIEQTLACRAVCPVSTLRRPS